MFALLFVHRISFDIYFQFFALNKHARTRKLRTAIKKTDIAMVVENKFRQRLQLRKPEREKRELQMKKVNFKLLLFKVELSMK